VCSVKAFRRSKREAETYKQDPINYNRRANVNVFCRNIDSIHTRALMNNLTVNTHKGTSIKNTISHTIDHYSDVFRSSTDHPQGLLRHLRFYTCLSDVKLPDYDLKNIKTRRSLGELYVKVHF
jgi:hypothetical protein